MTQKIDYHVDLHLHTHYSNISGFKDSTNKPKDVMLYASSLGKKAVAFTDHESLGGVNKHLSICKELKANGELPEDFQVIIGNEIYLVDEDEMNQQMANKERVPFYHFILLAKDDIGYRQLKELSTRAWMRIFTWRGIERKPTFYTDLEEIVGANPGHLVATSACLGGYLAKHVLSEEYDKAEDFIAWCQDVFGKENFYLEMQPHYRKYDESGEEIITEQEIVNSWIRDSGYQATIATDAHYLTADHRAIHKAFLTSDNDEDKAGVRERSDFYETTYIMSSEDLHGYLDFYLGEEFVDECIMNTWKIKESVEGYNINKSQIVCEIPLPPEEEWFQNEEMLDMFYENHEEFKYCLDAWESRNLYDGYLMSLCMKGASDEFLIPSKEEWWDTFKRLDQEFEEILGISELAGYNMSAYFIVMNKFIDIIWNDANSILGISRGSASGFLINYLLEIVQINPLKQPLDLEHWRFIHKSKPALADIDIDINSLKADVVFAKSRDYMQSIGGDLVHVGTYKTETLKSAIQTACRGLGISNDIGMYLSSLIPVDRGTVRTFKDMWYGNEEEGFEPHQQFINEVMKYEGLFEVLKGVEGLISARGIHASGVIPSLDILDCSPLMVAKNGSITTQFSLEDCEACGGLKLDYLKTEAVSMIQQTMELLVEYGHIKKRETLKETYRHSIHPNVLDFNKSELFEVLGNGELLKAFQYETLTGMKTLLTIKPHSLVELTNTNSLMRLVASDGEQPAERYIRLREHPEQWEQEMIDFGLNEEERKIMHEHLDKDFGTLSSQEGMMLLCMDKRIAGFDIPQANDMRKNISKKNKEKVHKSQKMFYEAGAKLGTRRVLLEYVMEVQIAMQLGLSK